MRVYLGSDHAGFELKNHLVDWLKNNGHEPVDCGPHIYDAVDDYPPFCLRAAEKTAADAGSLGIVIGGSGNGEQIAANKVKGVRAILAWSVQTAQLGREHNNANVISVGGRMHTQDEAVSFIEAFLATPYSDEERHTRRIEMLSAYETTGELPRSRPTTRRADPAAGRAARGRVARLFHSPKPSPRSSAVPEGHTIHRLAEDHLTRFAGWEVAVSSPQGRFAESAALLDGRILDGVDAHGKHLFLGFEESGWIHIHLGLFGKYAIGPAPAPPPTDTVRLRLANDDHFSDLRGPTTCAWITDEEKRAISDRLGPDPCEAATTPTAPGPVSPAPAPPSPPCSWTRRSSRASATSTAPRSSSARHRPVPPGQGPHPRRVGRHVGRPGRPDARGRAQQPHRHRPRRAPARGDGPAAPRR